MIRILLADDHRVVREGIRDRLQQEPDLAVVGEAADGAEALRLAEGLRPDVLVLDIEMPKRSGIDVARALAGQSEAPRVIVLTAYDAPEHVAELLAAGVAGYLTKDESLSTLVEAIRGVSSGETGWLSPRIAARSASLGEAADATAPPGGLTTRETEVLRLVAEGLTNADVAARLFLSEHTVRNHLASIFGKTGVRNRAEAATWAWRARLVGD